MPALDFTVLADAVAIVEQRTGLTQTDEWDTLLEQTAGNQDSTPVYRPYAVAALLLGNAQHEAKVLEAEGVKFSAPAATLRALLSTQAAWDESLDLTVPAEWTVEKLRTTLLTTGGIGLGSRMTRATSTF